MLRVILWIVLTAVAVVFVLRYAAKVKKDPSKSLVGFDIADDEDEESAEPVDIDGKLTGTQKLVLLITGLTFGLMIFSVIPWVEHLRRHPPVRPSTTRTTSRQPSPTGSS